MAEIRVLIADDTALAREGLKRMFETTSNIKVVGEITSAQEALRKVREYSPDILIMDLKWFGDESAGWVAIKEIKDNHPEIKIIAITAFPNLIIDARRARADAAIGKEFSIDQLLNLINELVSRKKDFSGAIVANGLLDKLSSREIQVLKLLAEGLQDREIADRLSIAESTAKNHVRKILSKLEVRNRVEASNRARELNLFTE